MPDRVLDRNGAALRDSKQDKAVEPAGLDHAFEVSDEGFEGRILAGRVGQAIQSPVITQKSEAAGECIDPVSPNRAFPVEFEMRHPMRRTHDRRPGSGDGIGDGRRRLA